MHPFKFVAAGLAGLFILGASQAHAVPVTFDFTTLGTAAPFVLNVTSGGVDLRITAVNRDDPTGGLPPNQFEAIRVHHNANGLGARINPMDNTNLDSIGDDEALRFRIQNLPLGIVALRLDEVVFSGLTSSEEFTLTLDNDSIIHTDVVPSALPTWTVLADIPVDADRTGSLNFRFQTESSVASDNDAFRISKLTFELIPAAVPEPGTLALFGLGLAGLGLARRRKAS